MKRSREGRRPPEAYSADQLHRFLVSDAVKRHSTELGWAIAAYVRIGKLRGSGPEEAIIAVRTECFELTGMDLPVHEPITKTELDALMGPQ